MNEKAWFLLAVFWINIIGSLYGYYFYQEQLSATPWYLWIFTPDCPFYTTMFSLVLVGLLVGYRSDLFNFIVAIGLIKYGIWTGVALSLYNQYFFSLSSDIWFASSTLFILHVGMALEGFSFPFARVKGWHVAVALAWFLLNDILDYFGPAVHPYLPPVDLTLIMGYTFISTFVATFIVWKVRNSGIRVLPELKLAPS